MSQLARHPASPFGSLRWEPEVVTLMDESHLVATGSSPALRLRFGSSLVGFLRRLPQAEVLVYYGELIHDMESFCHQLERNLPCGRVERRFEGPGGVAAALRERYEPLGRAPAQYRYHIWHDAQHLLSADRRLFARILDMIAGIGAEAEYVDDDALLIHRMLLVGGEDLAGYYNDTSGQLRAWLPDQFAEPFWHVVTGLRRPEFSLLSIDALARNCRALEATPTP